MTRQFKYFLITIAFVLSVTAFGQSNLPSCQGSDATRWSNCFGSWTGSNGNKYVGEVKDGKANGQGTYTWANGDRHVGEWKDDKRNVQGTSTYANGDKYVGEWKDDKKHGQGTYTYADGDKYVGEYKNDKPNGQGTYFFLANNQFKGDKYVGEYKDNKKNGQGTFTWADGVKYVGEIKDGKLNGRAIKYSADGSIKESGIYKDDKLVTSQYIDPNSFTRIARNNSAPAFIKTTQGCLAWVNPATSKTIITWDGNCSEGYTNGIGNFNWYEDNHLIQKYLGGMRSGKFHGYGTVTFADGKKYVGEWKDDNLHGQGIFTTSDGERLEGIFEENKFIREAKVNLPNLDTNTANNAERNNLELERQRLAEERRKLEAQKAQIEQEKKASRIAIKGSASQPDANGDFTITIQTGADTASLKIDGEEVGGKRDGNYVIKRVARVGEENSYLITARDVFGNTDSVTITVARQVADSRPAIPRLNPASVKVQQSRDAVAIIIGIENYRRVAKADFANADAKEFYTYASRALGIKPENIKLLVDDGADDIEMLNAFQNWLPLKVNKGKTDVYVFYSGHGYPSQDGNSLYFLPFNVDKQYLDRTSVKQKEVVAALQKAQAKSVTMFIDACYSGQTRGGEVLIAGLKPIVAKTDEKAYPAEFTVITASAADQFSSASQDLKHGIFSFYLMKGLEGDADLNKDGKITSGELQQYLSEMVGKQAMGLNRTQNTQLFGDANKVLVGR